LSIRLRPFYTFYWTFLSPILPFLLSFLHFSRTFLPTPFFFYPPPLFMPPIGTLVPIYALIISTLLFLPSFSFTDHASFSLSFSPLLCSSFLALSGCFSTTSPTHQPLHLILRRPSVFPPPVQFIWDFFCAYEPPGLQGIFFCFFINLASFRSPHHLPFCVQPLCVSSPLVKPLGHFFFVRSSSLLCLQALRKPLPL